MSNVIYRIVEKMHSGELRHPIRIMKKADNYDLGGGHGPGQWQDFDLRWAYIASWAQVEKYQAQQKIVELTQLCVVRFDPLKTVSADMAILLEQGHPQDELSGTMPSRKWKVTTVENYEERNIWLIIAGIEFKPNEASF